MSDLGTLACLSAVAMESMSGPTGSQNSWFVAIVTPLRCQPGPPHTCLSQVWDLEMSPASLGLAEGARSFRCPKPGRLYFMQAFIKQKPLLSVRTAEGQEGNVQACADPGQGLWFH